MALRVSRPRCSHTEDYARNIEQTGSRHFQKPAFELASLFVSLGAGGILSTTCDDYLLACPSFLSLVPLRSTKIFGGEKSLFFLLFLFSPFRL